MITVEMDDEDAELFKLFRKYQDQFKIFMSDGVMDLKQGKATIHKDNEGEIRMTEVTRVKRH